MDNEKLTAVGGGETPTPPVEETFTITPSKGYEIEDVAVDNVSKGAVGTYTFENVTEAHTITASFTEKAVTLPDSIHEDFNNSDELPAGWTVEGPVPIITTSPGRSPAIRIGAATRRSARRTTWAAPPRMSC